MLVSAVRGDPGLGSRGKGHLLGSEGLRGVDQTRGLTVAVGVLH